MKTRQRVALDHLALSVDHTDDLARGVNDAAADLRSILVQHDDPTPHVSRWVMNPPQQDKPDSWRHGYDAIQVYAARVLDNDTDLIAALHDDALADRTNQK